MSQIGDYLAQGRAGKVYDPNQGLYMDPATGQAFVPTFTNIQSSNIQGQVEKSMGGTPVQADPYLIGGGPGDQQGGVMPGRGEQPQAPDINDPWAMANEHMKSSGFKTEIYKEMFGRDPSSGFRDEAERERFYKAMKSTRNVLVDRFKYQITGKRKQSEDRQKDARKGLSQKEAMKMQAESIAMAEAQRGEDEISFDERHGGKSARQVGIDNYLEALELDKKLHGKGGMPDREKPKKEYTDVNKYLSETYDPDKATGKDDLDKPTSPRVYFQDLKPDIMMKVRMWANDKAAAANPGLGREQLNDAAKAILHSLTQDDVDEATSGSGERKTVTAREPVENKAMFDVAGGA
jgi:hypothetical protein